MPHMQSNHSDDERLNILSEEQVVETDQRFLVSQAMDNELPEETEINWDACAYDQWELYHLVGDTLRSDEVVPSTAPRILTDRVRSAIADEPTYISPQTQKKKKRPSTHSPYSKWFVSAAAVAAAVVLTIVLVPKQQSTSTSEPLRFAADSDLLSPFVSAHRSFVGFSPYRQPVAVHLEHNS